MSQNHSVHETPVAANAAIIEEIANQLALSEGIAIDVSRMREAYLALAQVAYEAVIKSGFNLTSYGLQHSNGYVREVANLQEAIDLKSGAVISGRLGVWKNHTIVSHTRTSLVTEWVPVAE